MVLIKGMETPKNCALCDIYCGHTAGEIADINDKERPSDCPIISLDDVIAKMEKTRDETPYWYDGCTFVTGVQECIRILRELEGDNAGQ